jgi:hypothetical protein
MKRLLIELRFPVIFLIVCMSAGYVDRIWHFDAPAGLILGGIIAYTMIYLHNKRYF